MKKRVTLWIDGVAMPAERYWLTATVGTFDLDCKEECVVFIEAYRAIMAASSEKAASSDKRR